MLITRCPGGAKPTVDLTDVVFIDNIGEEVLSFFGRFGAAFVAPNSYTLDVCQRLNLCVAPNSISPKNTLGTAHTNGSPKTSK